MRLAALLCIVVTLLATVSGQSNSNSQNNDSQKNDSQKNGSPKQDSAGSGAIIYSEGGAFMIEDPKGWVADHETGQGMGICCVFYPQGSNFDNAETVIYPNIATKGPGQATLKEFMESDLSEFREHNPEMTYEDASDVSMKSKRVAKVRYFHRVNKGSSEAIAYIDEDKIIAVIVVSSKTQRDWMVQCHSSALCFKATCTWT